MDTSLRALCDALKKVIGQLKPQYHSLSFLLLTGRVGQGKTTLLRQSHVEHVVVDAERNADIYYNQHGLIVELGESWLNQNKNLLQYTLKQLNRCHRALTISGIILCVDINDLLTSEPLQLAERCKAHTQFLKRFGQSLNYRVDTAIMFTKADALAGFCEFFQNEHASELQKPLGFSLDWISRQGKLLSNFKAQFERFIEVLGQQVIHKMHPARSGVKRTLIREFPLQLASLSLGIQSIIQTIPPQSFRIRAIYFTSGEQGGISLDKLNKKIQHEYALTVQDTFPQSINYRAYFIEGALSAFQAQTKQQAVSLVLPNKWTMSALAGTVALSLVWIGSQHFKSAHLLDKASKELLTYDQLASQNKGDTAALYHLTKATTALEQLSAGPLYLPTLQQLKIELTADTKAYLHGNFLPSILSDIEQTLLDTQQPHSARYQALKIYLMLNEPTKFSESDVMAWFQDYWKKTSAPTVIAKKRALLEQVLQQPRQPIAINQQIVSDIRNYLNALPVSYLYYSFAKPYFPQDNQSIDIDGFNFADKTLPLYFTKIGFKQVIAELPAISAQLQKDNWVLARQDLKDLPSLLQEAYCYDYVTWWQTFMHHSNPLHFNDYPQAKHVAEAIRQSDTITKIVDLFQQQTSPDFGENATLFNQQIASKFTELNLMSQSATRDLTLTISELEKFLTTLSVVNDQGRTAFALTKSRFQGDELSNPLSALYMRVRQLPEPISSWAKQLADDTWFILINDTRNFINQQWQQTVIPDYQQAIANRYPFDATKTQEVTIADFDRFFSSHGVLNSFIEQYLKPFIDISQAQWQLKELNDHVLPISSDMINELIRANVISNMFFPDQRDTSKIEFSLQKVNLDPVVANLQLVIGSTSLRDTQDSESVTQFNWPQSNAKLTLNSIEGNHYELDEPGPWAFFKILQKVNVLVDEQDSSNLQILFEINGNSGRYLLKTQNQVNPFIPGILNGFVLNESIA